LEVLDQLVVQVICVEVVAEVEVLGQALRPVATEVPEDSLEVEVVVAEVVPLAPEDREVRVPLAE
jgi:hypothetical protein